MLRLVHCMHSAEVLHADLKPDNLLLRLGTAVDLQQWQAGSRDAWQHFGLTVIDFGRSMDLSLLTPATVFKVGRNSPVRMQLSVHMWHQALSRTVLLPEPRWVSSVMELQACTHEGQWLTCPLHYTEACAGV